MSGNVWFTSDTHFGHRAMTAEGAEGTNWRNVVTVAEHDEMIMTRWNETVRPGDQIWHLGEVVMGRLHIVQTMSKLHGTKHLIAGNHDPVWPGHRDSWKFQRQWLEAFESVQPFARRRVGKGESFVLSHFPYEGDHHKEERFAQFRLRDEGKWIIHGHVHDAWKIRDRQINVGVDVWGFQPVSLDELVAFMQGEQTPF